MLLLRLECSAGAVGALGGAQGWGPAAHILGQGLEVTKKQEDTPKGVKQERNSSRSAFSVTSFSVLFCLNP